MIHIRETEDGRQKKIKIRNKEVEKGTTEDRRPKTEERRWKSEAMKNKKYEIRKLKVLAIGLSKSVLLNKSNILCRLALANGFRFNKKKKS